MHAQNQPIRQKSFLFGKWRWLHTRSMEVIKEVSKLQAVQLGFSPGISVQHVNIYDLLTAHVAKLYEEKQFRQANNYQLCWAKNGQVYLWQSKNPSIIKLKHTGDLVAINPTCQSQS